MEEYGTKLGSRIREIRRIKNETQQQLGIAVGVVQQSVAAWEKGRSLLNIPSLIRIAEHYEISSDWLLDLPKRV
jgi:transcriptional regulator with XRE-family HTH domain